MIRISEMVLRDALMEGNQRFRTIRGLVCGDTISQDRYGILFGALYQGKNIMVKVLFDPLSERATKLHSTIETIQKLNIPFIAPASLFTSELSVVTLDNQHYMADVILIEDTGVAIMDFLQEEDGDSIIDDFIKLIAEITRRGFVFDLISIDAFKYSRDRGLYISAANNFLFDGVVSTNREVTRAFSNYLMMNLLQFIIEVYNCSSKVEVVTKVIYTERYERFDLRRLDYFLSGEYVADLLTLTERITRDCDFNCAMLRETLTSMNLHSKLSLLAATGGDEASDDSYIVVGNHAENRILVRDRVSGRLGYVDFGWHVVVDFVFDGATDFVEGVAVCIREELYGVINSDGEVIVPFEYDYIEWDSKANLFYWRKDGSELNSSRRAKFLNR